MALPPKSYYTRWEQKSVLPTSSCRCNKGRWGQEWPTHTHTDWAEGATFPTLQSYQRRCFTYNWASLVFELVGYTILYKILWQLFELVCLTNIITVLIFFIRMCSVHNCLMFLFLSVLILFSFLHYHYFTVVVGHYWNTTTATTISFIRKHKNKTQV